jgi:lysophospholipid acyltransferase (LPLAT)-like uncharacterized protein
MPMVAHHEIFAGWHNQIAVFNMLWQLHYPGIESSIIVVYSRHKRRKIIQKLPFLGSGNRGIESVF